MLVRHWMTEDPIAIGPEESVSAAALLMNRHKIRRLPVVKKDEESGIARLVGIVTLTDISRAYPADLNPLSPRADLERLDALVGHYMTSPVQFTKPKTPIEAVAHRMATRKIGAMPVVRKKKLVGIITESDVFRAMVAILGFGRGGVRITFDPRGKEHPLHSIMSVAQRHGVKLISVVCTKKTAILRATGEDEEAFVKDLWNSGLPVMHVLRQEADKKS